MDRDPICEQLIVPTSSAGAQIRLTPRKRHGEVLTIEEVSAMNEDSQGSDVTIGLYDGNNYIWLETLDLATTGWWYNFHLKFTTLTDYQVAVRVENHSPGDIVRCNILGYVRAPYTTP